MNVLTDKCSTCFYSNTRNDECCENCQYFDGTYCVYEELYYDLKPIKVPSDGNCERFEENESDSCD